MKIPVEEELTLGKNSSHIPEHAREYLSWMEEDTRHRIQKTSSGYVYHEPERTDNILFNGRKLSELNTDSEFGEGVHPLKEGDVIRIFREDDTWYAQDHSTVFGVFVNNQPVDGKQPLRYLDVLRIGHTLFVYREDALLYNHKVYDRNELKIDIRERSVREFFKKKVLLEDIRLNIRPGEMVLILGGSGAGKTTFINAVMGYEKADGTILEGDYDIYRHYNKMKYDIGFVPQQDLLRLEDSVYETLDNAAQMKMPADTPKEERQARISEILEMFGLEQIGRAHV